MRILMTGFICLFLCVTTSAQSKINESLKKELDSIFEKDQSLRELVSSDLLQTKADSIAASFNVPREELLNYIVKTIPLIDSQNLHRVEAIIKQYGYPGLSLVGPGTNEAAFFVIQHSTSIDKYLPLIKKAVDQKQLNFRLYAMMLDRSLMYKGKEQVYGTQGKGLEVLNAATGKKEFKTIIWPVKDPANINKRRKQAGFKLTIEEYAKQQMGIEYKKLSLADVKKMQGL